MKNLTETKRRKEIQIKMTQRTIDEAELDEHFCPIELPYTQELWNYKTRRGLPEAPITFFVNGEVISNARDQFPEAFRAFYGSRDDSVTIKPVFAARDYILEEITRKVRGR